MPEFIITRGFLVQKGRVFRPTQTITLTEERAAQLGSQVVSKDLVDTNKAIADMNLKELKALAKVSNIENYSSKDKGTLQAELLAAQDAATPDVPVVADDEPSSD